MSNIIVMGHKRHGKDSACEMLYNMYGMTFVSSSYFACQKFIFDQMKDAYGYRTVDDCFNDRDNHRAYWYNAIREYNKADRCRLGREIFEQNDIYCGIRDREEFYSLKANRLVNLSIWIDANKRLPPEDSSSMNLTADDADIIITNNGQMADLMNKLGNLFSQETHRKHFKDLETASELIDHLT